MTIQSQLDNMLENLPEGVAAYFLHGDPEIGFRDTVCVLVKADGKMNHRLPRQAKRYEPLSTGIAFYTEGDEVDEDKGELIALGRALKAYYSSHEKSGYSLAITKVDYEKPLRVVFGK